MGWHEHHAHLFLSGARERVEELFAAHLPDFQTFEPPQGTADPQTGIGRLNAWIRNFFVPILVQYPDWTALCTQAALEQAVKDGVSRFEASFNVGRDPDVSEEKFEKVLCGIMQVHAQTAPELELRIDLGFERPISPENQLLCLKKYLRFAEKSPQWAKLLYGIDLYDVEDAAEPEAFREIFETARNAGLRRKVHVGEFGTPEEIRHTVEVLEPDEIQHGIHAAGSPDVLKFLADRGTILNLAPASNRILGAMDLSQKPHPIRKIFDAGVRFTLSSDDFLLFGASISDQFKELTPWFSDLEITQIRQNCQTF